MLDGFLYDARFALRGLRRDRAFTLAAIAMLGLAIGLNATVFAVSYAMLYRGEPRPAVAARRRVAVRSVDADRHPSAVDRAGAAGLLHPGASRDAGRAGHRAAIRVTLRRSC